MRKNTLLTSMRAVSPIIATLLLVAIAVVGGAIIFSFSQGYFASTQLSGPPAIDLINVLGYDLRDSATLYLHNQQEDDSPCPDDCVNGHLSQGDYITVFLTNDGSRKAALADVRFAGSVYTYDKAGDDEIFSTEYTAFDEGEYRIITNITDDDGGIYSTEPTSVIEPGKTVTLVLHVSEDIRDNSPIQLKLTTSNSAVKVATVQAGQREG